MQISAISNQIRSLGRELGPSMMEGLLTIFDNEQKLLVARQPASATNVAYGDHERHVLDIYGADSRRSDASKPVFVFVHGGGFLKGDKGDDERWYNACVGRMAAELGWLGVVINYRLAPDFTWPSGGDDVSRVVAWLNDNIHEYGGDANNIILCGTSAGACHVATYLQLNPGKTDIKAAVLLSGLYGVTPLDERDTLYYGDASMYQSRMPLPALIATSIPLFIACTELDPERFQQECIGLLQARLQVNHTLDRSMILSGHNHYSIAGHLGTSDRRLSSEIRDFVNEVISA
ncbi:alpha/beta hydrolase [Alteromonas gilva]|uniref:Alpha/beta hydrolase n=1 Tax=Alteromonas gilva TaxID=2987522 RepID=A0ABT5L832_9ALTE|nr:alpha/beta hydrolase [Alteromonas gilva]MDC8833057.1 alpha/beta hydrolase [Alteromonas gilva]